ncbi:MAG: hypothetical protein HQL50_05495, partial [Magnetococcales bacterium]|nr:hypothetical protein [Magnetococcales bacterium]
PPNKIAILSYLGILCVVPMVLRRNDIFVRFHTLQGMILWIWMMIAIFSLHIPGVGLWVFSGSVVAVTGLSGLGIISVLLGRTWKLPVVAWLVERYLEPLDR